MGEIQAATPPRRATPLHILIVGDEIDMQLKLSGCLTAIGHQVNARANIRDALADASRQAFDLIFLDVGLSGENGQDPIGRLAALNPLGRVIAVSNGASIDAAADAIRRGASDCLPVPFSGAQVELMIARTIERRRLEIKLESLQSILNDDPELNFPTDSPLMRRTLDLARQVADSAAPVLIVGERGTGKSRLARAIHAWSSRADSACAVVSCQTPTAEALEDKLFGLASDKAADAPPEKLGRIEFCNGGTLVLDEIGATPLSIQPKIERLLIDRQYERRDDFAVRGIDARIIATSGTSLEDAVAEKQFRQELLLALDVVRVEIPPLRLRPEDIRSLAQRYLAWYGRQHNRKIAGFTTDALNALTQHTWPGNQREFRNLIERAVILCPSEQIELKHFPPNFLNAGASYQPGDLVPLDTIEDIHIRGVLAATGTVKGAANVLGVNYSTLWRRLRKTAGEIDADPRETGHESTAK